MESYIVKWFQSFSSTPLDNVFKIISKFGEVIPFAVIFLLFYWFLKKETAIKYAFIALIGAVLNSGIKRLFKRPRPYMDDMQVVDKYGSTGYSFPSGHSVFSVLTYGGQYKLLKQKVNKKINIANLIISICLVLLVMISRVYLGQHYLSDVISGALFGLLWLILCNELYSYIEEYINKILIVLIPIMLAFAIIKANPFIINENMVKYYAICGVATGIIIGYLLDIKLIKFSPKLIVKQNIIKLLINLSITSVCCVLMLLLKSHFNLKLYVYYLMLLAFGLIVTSGCSIINKLLFKRGKNENL